MKIADEACLAKGVVNPYFIDVSTGRKIPFSRRNNQLSFMSAEAMAAAFGGDPSYIPSKVGFIYSPLDAVFSGYIDRRQTWDALIRELGSANADVQVVSFSYSPSLGGYDFGGGDSSDSSGSGDGSSDYCTIKPTGSNAITFHAVSNSQDKGARGTVPFKQNDYIYQAVLLGSHGGEYYVISRVSLDKNATYLQKPNRFEIALDWTIAFR